MLKQLSPQAALTTEASARIDTFVDNVVRHKRDAKRAVLEYVGQIEELDDELWTLQNTHKGETAARVVATILTKHECRVEFQLTYRKPPSPSCSPFISKFPEHLHAYASACNPYNAANPVA